MSYKCFFDGGLRNNRMTFGWIVFDQDQVVVASGSGVYNNSKKTVNLAEYEALNQLLTYMVSNNINDATVFGDSQTVCYQVNEVYATKAPHLKQKLREVKTKIELIEHISVRWIPRQRNLADRLARF